MENTGAAAQVAWLRRRNSNVAVNCKRGFMDFRRAGLIHEAAELKAQVVEAAVRDRVILEFFDDGLEVGK